jgi:hypothetical protein
MKTILLPVLMVLMFITGAYSYEYVDTTNMSFVEKISMVSTLEDDILILEMEVNKCKKKKKGWIAATVVGSAGVVATGVAAGVQGAKISKTNKELQQHKEDISAKETELKTLQQK